MNNNTNIRKSNNQAHSSVYTTIGLAPQPFDNKFTNIAEQMLHFFLQHPKDDISMQEVEAFSENRHFDVNDCFSVMSLLQNAHIVEKVLYDTSTGRPIPALQKHRSANTPHPSNNIGVRWTLNSAY